MVAQMAEVPKAMVADPAVATATPLPHTVFQQPPRPLPPGLAAASSSAVWEADAGSSLGGGSGRNLAERKDWSAEEDLAIKRAYIKHGAKWRLIASTVGGRSDDAVRNRWNRIKDVDVDGESGDERKPAAAAKAGGEGTSSSTSAANGKAHGSKAAGSSKAARGGGSKGEGEGDDKADRVSWSRSEDEKIVHSVNELGHKWHRIAQRLPGRTEHAIRNRYARLVMLAGRGTPIVVSSGKGAPIGIQLVPTNAAVAP